MPRRSESSQSVGQFLTICIESSRERQQTQRIRCRSGCNDLRARGGTKHGHPRVWRLSESKEKGRRWSWKMQPCIQEIMLLRKIHFEGNMIAALIVQWQYCLLVEEVKLFSRVHKVEGGSQDGCWVHKAQVINNKVGFTSLILALVNVSRFL